tara:strand:- start:2382 stop:3551 length:1170 start_codon:yes stop_codon:yes gene_type:complete
MNKKVLLVGCGSEIGSMLLSMNQQVKDKFIIDTVLTNKISNNEKEDMDSINARLILCNPQMIDKIKVDYKKNTLIIDKKKIKFFFGDINSFKLNKIKKKFNATIIATSKKHISNKNLMKKFTKISDLVFGVAESEKLPSIYPNLMNIKSKILEHDPKTLIKDKEKIFALGSCQSNGWQAQLRGIIEVFKKYNLNKFKMLSTELDIVHPDTPQGRLGTKSDNPREQDARNNFRPSFSQAKISMKKLFPNSNKVHTVSLRTLISPPGYQISRFYFQYELKNKKRLNKGILINELRNFAKKSPGIIRVEEKALGSKAYEMAETAAVILIDKQYIYYNENPFLVNRKNKPSENICEIITQGYVHNTRGYCRSVLNCLKEILNSKKNKAINYWI